MARTQDIAWKQIDDEIVILDLRTHRYLSLNHSGTVLWPQLVAGASRQQLVDALVDAYRVPPVQAATDLERLLAQLSERDLLTIEPPPPAG